MQESLAGLDRGTSGSQYKTVLQIYHVIVAGGFHDRQKPRACTQGGHHRKQTFFQRCLPGY